MSVASDGAGSTASERAGSDPVRRETEASVSRETESPPPPPEAAAALFGDRLDRVVRFVELLAGPGVVRGLIGPREVPKLWDRHIMNCAVVADLIPVDAAVDDVGSGAGLPGIVLALARPDLRIALVEPLLRRTVFLEELVSELALDRVVVVRARAEERVSAQAEVDVVTARAVAPLDRLAGWCLPLLKPGGVLLALKGASAAAELVAAQGALRKAGGDRGEVLVVGAQLVDPPTTVVRITRMTRSGASTSQARRRKR